MATAMALLLTLAANESCCVPTAPLISTVVGVVPMPEAAKLSVPSLALAKTCTATFTDPPCGICAALTCTLVMSAAFTPLFV